MTRPSALTLLPLAIIITAALVHADDVYEMDDVVVTASRTAQTIDETLAPVTVITRKEIEQSQASSVPELLRRVPGMQVAPSGGAGSLTYVFLRGTVARQTLVLIDGQKINQSTFGNAPLEFPSPEMIERIEVVRGPRSSLYGADAVGGVIQIFTRKGHGKPQMSIAVGGGSRGTLKNNLNYGGKIDTTSFNFGVSHYETDGFDSTNDNNSSHSGPDTDDDAYRNKSFFTNISHEFANNSEAGFSVTHNEGKSEYDASTYYPNPGAPYEAYKFFRTSTLNAWYSIPVNDKWNTQFETGYIKDTSRDLGKNGHPDANLENKYMTNKRHSFNWKTDIAWQDHQLLTVGMDYQQDRVDGDTIFKDPISGHNINSRDNKAVFVQNQSSFNRSDMQLGLRRDENEVYGYNTTGNISWGYNLSDDYRFIASYGTAFRAPTFSELYNPNAQWANPNLKPEKANNTEIELRGHLMNSVWAIAIYQNDMEDMIGSDANYKPINIASARMRGVEFSLKNELFGWDTNSTLTYLQAKDRNTDKDLNRRARQLATFDADHSFGNLSIGSSLRAQGKSYNDVDNTVIDSGFATIDIRTTYNFSLQFKGELKLVNLLDRNYETYKGYNGEPRGVFAAITWMPEI